MKELVLKIHHRHGTIEEDVYDYDADKEVKLRKIMDELVRRRAIINYKIYIRES